MENWQKGLIAEHKVVIRAMEKGIILSKPLVEAIPYDFIIDDGALVKAQVKWAEQKPSHSSGAVLVNLRTRKNGGSTRYDDGDFDLLLVYIPQLDTICAFGPEIFVGKAAINVRIEPSKNNQSKNCILANDYLW